MDTAIAIGSIVVIIVAVVEASKMAGLPGRYAPLMAVAIGLASAVLFGGANFLSVASGVILGLSTTGGYRVVKTSLLNK